MLEDKLSVSVALPPPKVAETRNVLSVSSSISRKPRKVKRRLALNVTECRAAVVVYVDELSDRTKIVHRQKHRPIVLPLSGQYACIG